MADAWKSMYTDPTIRQLENLPPDGEITAELQAKYSTLFTRKVEDVRLAGLNLAAGDLVRDQETERIANLATPAYWAQCGVHPVDLEDCAPGKHALQRLLYQAVLDFKVKHPKLGVIDTPTVSSYVRAVLSCSLGVNVVRHSWGGLVTAPWTKRSALSLSIHTSTLRSREKQSNFRRNM